MNKNRILWLIFLFFSISLFFTIYSYRSSADSGRSYSQSSSMTLVGQRLENQSITLVNNQRVNLIQSPITVVSFGRHGVGLVWRSCLALFNYTIIIILKESMLLVSLS